MSQFAELPPVGKHAALAFNRAEKLVVIIDAIAERAAESGNMPLCNNQLVVNLPAHLVNSLCMLRNFRLLPSKFDSSQKGNQGRWRRHHHMVLRAEFNQRWIRLKCCAE